MSRIMSARHRACLLTSIATIAFSTHAAEAADQDIVVTAHPRAGSQSALAAPVNVVSSDDLARTGGSSLGAALGRQIGVSETGFAAGASRPVIRGQGEARVRVTENSIGTGDVSDISPDHGVPIDPLAVERIEILRGPATLRFGSQAIGGVVNAVTNRVPQRLTERPIEATVQGAMDTVSDLREGAFRADGSSGPFALHADAFKRSADDYDIPIPPGVLEFSRAKSWGEALGGGVVTEKGRLGAAFHRYGSVYFIPGPEDPNEPLSIAQSQNKWMVEGAAKIVPGFETVSVEAGVTDYRHDEIDGDTVGSTFINREWELRTEAVHKPLGPLSGAFGVQLGRRDLSAEGEGSDLLAPSHTANNAIYLFEEIALTKRLTFSFAGRGERTHVEGTPQSGIDTARRFTPLSASAGLVATLPADIVVGGTASLAERAPTAQELFSKGPHDVAETFEIGDPTLGKERALSGEIFVEKRKGDFTGEARGFYTSYSHYVFPFLTGVQVDEAGNPDPAGPFRQLFYIQSDVTFRGAEAEGRYVVGEFKNARYGVSGRFDYVRAKDKDGGNLARIPPMRYGGGLFYESDRTELRLDALRVARQDKVDLNENETETAGYLLLSASLSLKVIEGSAKQPEVTLVLAGDNLLDKEARNHVSFKKDDIVLPGRNFRLTLRARY